MGDNMGNGSEEEDDGGHNIIVLPDAVIKGYKEGYEEDNISIRCYDQGQWLLLGLIVYLCIAVL